MVSLHYLVLLLDDLCFVGDLSVFMLVQISLKTCTVPGQLPWILWVSWLGNVERKIFISLFSSLSKFLRGIFWKRYIHFGALTLVFFPHKFLVSWSRYDEAPVEYKPYRQKDGALLAIGALCDRLKQTEPYKSELERMLVQHVFPEFSSPVGHLRAKVCYIKFFLYVSIIVLVFIRLLVVPMQESIAY